MVVARVKSLIVIIPQLERKLKQRDRAVKIQNTSRNGPYHVPTANSSLDSSAGFCYTSGA
jgi:hypothetical protein